MYTYHWLALSEVELQFTEYQLMVYVYIVAICVHVYIASLSGLPTGALKCHMLACLLWVGSPHVDETAQREKRGAGEERDR